MELKHYAVAAASVLALAGAQAQTSHVLPETTERQGDTIIIVTPPDAGTPGSTAVFTPMDDANRTLTREEIKAETRSAVRQGEIPRGELGQGDETQHTQPADTYDLRNANRP